MVQKRNLKREISLHLMLVPGLFFIIVFSYIPMAGIVIGFQKYVPALGVLKSKWVGLDNFKYMVSLPDTFQVLWNTVFIATMKMVTGLAVPILLALLLNEVRKRWFKRAVQTIVYLPYFLSWIILGGILRDILSLEGIVNSAIAVLGMKPVFFLGDNKVFPYMLVITDMWKNMGFSTIVYLAAITNISPTLYEAATVDGANRLKQVWHITLPGMRPIIILMMTLSLGSILNAGFDQGFTLYSPIVYKSGDIIDTLVYRLGLVDAQYGLATAVGLFNSVVSFALVSLSYYQAYRFANYRIF